MKLSGYRLLALWSTDGRGSRTLSPECTCNLKSQCVSAMCLKALPARSLSLCCLLGNPSLGQSQQGNSNREREKKKICSVEIFLCPFNMCYIPLATRPIICDHTLRCSVWLVGWNNYSTYTYFQLWTKCRVWSRSKPAENAAEREKM